MLGWVAPALRVSVVVVVFCIVAWTLSSDNQRRRLMVGFGISESIEQAEQTGLVLVGPGLEIELLPPLPQPEPPARSTPLPSRQITARRPNSSTAAETTSDAIAHGDNPCSLGLAANPSRARPSAQVYQWTDDSGGIVFSDRAPASAAAIPVATEGDVGVGRFSADFDYQGLVPPSAFQQQLEIDIDGVFHFLADDLGLRDVHPVHVRLSIIDGRDRFARAAAGTGLAAQTLSGFYRFSDNQAVVRWQGEARTRGVARHEIAHLALGNWLGNVPLWLNEGLAELVERMQFQQSFATTQPTPRQGAQLQRMFRNGHLPALRTFLAASRRDWGHWGNELSYAYAWSVVHFLVEEPTRQRVLSELLNSLAEHRCSHLDDVAWLERRYPGGIERLEAEWHRWLLAGRVAQVQF